MIVYIEQVLIDNFIINFFIILCISYIFKANIKKINIIFSSFLGSIVALLVPLFNISSLFNFLIKILLSLTMVALLKRYKKITEFLLYYISFVLITFLFGGACLFLLISYDKNFNVNNYYSYSLPLGVIVVIIFFLMLTIKNIFKNIYKRKNINNYIFKIKLINGSKSDEILAYLDSGNFLQDTITKKPITIVDYNSLKNLLQEISLTDILLNRTDKLNKFFKNAHIQNISSINKGSKIIIFEIEKLEIFLNDKTNVINNACIGLTIKSFINDMGYSALLNPNLF